MPTTANEGSIKKFFITTSSFGNLNLKFLDGKKILLTSTRSTDFIFFLKINFLLFFYYNIKLIINLKILAPL